MAIFTIHPRDGSGRSLFEKRAEGTFGIGDARAVPLGAGVDLTVDRHARPIALLGPRRDVGHQLALCEVDDRLPRREGRERSAVITTDHARDAQVLPRLGIAPPTLR